MIPGGIELKAYSLGSLGIIPSCLLWGLVAVLGIGFAILVLRNGWKEGLRATAVLILLEWVFLIFCATVIFRDARVEREYILIPFDSYFHYPENSYFIEAATVNVMNVLMFIPIGLLLGLGFKRMTWKKVLLTGLGLSVLIEILQFVLRKGLCEIDDVIHNLLGCVVGYILALMVRGYINR